MQPEVLPSLVLPDRDLLRRHVFAALGCYWADVSDAIDQLPLVEPSLEPPLQLPLKLVAITMPAWAMPWTVNGQLLVPQECVSDQLLASPEAWRSVDWLLAVFLLLEGWHERLWEQQHGPIHSYSFHLKGWDTRAWQHAWVNRIGLFLRCWAAEQEGCAGAAPLSALPEASIHLTHDVDALTKTLAIRLKQFAFNLFKSIRALRTLHVVELCRHVRQAAAFLFSNDQWFTFDQLLALEHEAGIQATFHFYASAQPRNLRRWLLDPGYRIESQSLQLLWSRLAAGGHRVGLHPGFDTWRCVDRLSISRLRLEQACRSTVSHCRQHWLRFSWRYTWQAQALAGLRQDSTLMFNDRPGFRTSAALLWYPWDPVTRTNHSILALPTVLMDSHCYDYKSMGVQERQEAIRHWVNECKVVRGQISVLWHPHTLSRDYGWSGGFQQLLNAIKEASL